MKRKRLLNRLELVLFCAVMGACSGAVLWIFLKIIQLGTELFWSYLPGVLNAPAWYPVAVCTIGGAVIGLFRKRFGDYPQSMKTVIGTVKKTGTYPYRKIVVILIGAVLPLVIGSSVGPEAGMIGVIVALGCWVNENVKFAGKNARLYSNAGMAVSLSVLFASPLFGLFSVVENEGGLLTGEGDDEDSEPKILIYGVSIVAALGIVMLLNMVFGKVSEGFPSFENVAPDKWDILMILVYLICGIILGLFFEESEKWFEKLHEKMPPVAGEIIAGLVLGIAAALLPVIRFSGESQMAVLITDYAKYAPAAMIGIAFLKVLLTNMCIQMGLKGGHFFPLIFSAVCLGYGVSLLAFPMNASHAVFAAAVTTAASLGVSMKKPLAVTCLLFICFPVRMGMWILLAALIAGQAGRLKRGRTNEK
ncbi:MAG: chloride channel protein [Lachnospiraceae bacterium]|jgi:H+/Cl- antiporter ClcA